MKGSAGIVKMDQKRINSLIGVFTARAWCYFSSPLGWNGARVSHWDVLGRSQGSPSADVTALVTSPAHFSMWIQFHLLSSGPAVSPGSTKITFL